MWRDIDPRPDERERPELSRGSAGDQDRHESQSSDPRDVFSRDLDLPRGTRRQPVRDRDRSVELRDSEVRILATTGAFRVVPAKDLLDHRGRPSSSRQGELRRLREEGVVKPRELAHDSQLYRAYVHAAERLRRGGSTVKRVALDYELKRDYQRFLRDLNRERRRAERDADAAARDVADWAARRDLPVIDGHVHFPDVRIEYERPDGERKVEDVEVVTPHYRGAYAAAKGRTGFSCYRIDTGVGGRGGHSGRSPDPRIFEEFLG